ncbi:MAG: hypothetical protein H7A33_07615 [Deltaproteobacteria bacterium]|nr:hypothetical protein [Deltaproteobacteria bacterium]
MNINQMLSDLYESPQTFGNKETSLENRTIASSVLLAESHGDSAKYDSLSFLAAIKCASALEGFDALNAKDLESLISSARAAGYEIEVLGTSEAQS